MRLQQVSDRVSEHVGQVSNRMANLAEQYEVPEKLNRAYDKAYQKMSAASEVARRGAMAAYRTALEHPKTSIGGMIIAAALVGGLLWYMFGDERRPVQRRRRSTGSRVRAGTERRRKSRSAARPASA